MFQFYMEERIPRLLTTTNDCYNYKLSYIHSKDDYYEFMDTFKPLVKPSMTMAVMNTAKYMFDIVGYGIFVFIQNGKIHTFQPFANIYDIKPGSEKITPEDIDQLYENKISDLNVLKEKFYHKIINERREWVISGCNFYFWDDWWKDLELYIHIYYDMLNNTIPSTLNTCFFINTFDNPVLNKKKFMQFIHYDSGMTQLRQLFIPVLSACTTADHFDNLNIFPDAWELISQRKFGNSCRDLYYKKVEQVHTDWETKHNKIIFRGRNTSCYPNDFERNIRLKTSKLMNEIKENKKIKIDIDVGITDLTTNTFYTNNKLVYSNPKTIFSMIDKQKPVPMNEQSRCKYILDMDGFVTPWRLCFELSYNSCIVLIRSNYISWFYNEIQHNVNMYIINQHGDVKNELSRALLHFSTHDDDAKQIANGAVELYKKIINIDYARQYMKTLFAKPCFNIAVVSNGKSKKKKQWLRKSKKH
jgi:hypothetical protein